MRIMALDYGRKRIGIAFSDPLYITAQPYGYLENNLKLISKLQDLIQEQEVGEIVLGMPNSMSGNPNEMTKEVEQFGNRLKTSVSVPIFYIDERLTTSSAERLLVDSDVRRNKRKELRDQIAAAIILQSYLQTRGNRSE